MVKAGKRHQPNSMGSTTVTDESQNEAPIQDGYGDQPAVDELVALATEAEELRRRTSDKKVEVRPLGQQAIRELRAETKPPVIMATHLPANAVWEIVRPGEVGKGPVEFRLPLNWVGNSIRVLRWRLVQDDWAFHSGKIDQMRSAHGVTAEMGFSHNEVWVRAFMPRVSTSHSSNAVGIHRIHDWDDRNPEAASESVFQWLRDLDRRAQDADHTNQVLETMLMVGPGMQSVQEELARYGWVNATKEFIAPRIPGPGQSATIGFKLLTTEAHLPSRAYPDDAGFDLFVSEPTVIPPGEFVDVPVGVSVALPEGYFGRVTGRSSTLRNRGLLVNEGIIDTGYTGPLFAGCQNMTGEPVNVGVGERLAQLIIHVNATARFVATIVDEMPETRRGQAGFGSSGT
jgi:dUTP pyrophosphatase